MNDIQIIQKELQRQTELSLAPRKSPIFMSGVGPQAIIQGYCILFKEDTVIDAITYDAHTDSNTLGGETFLAGTIIYLSDITSLTLTSGAVFIYIK